MHNKQKREILTINWENIFQNDVFLFLPFIQHNKNPWEKLFTKDYCYRTSSSEK